jgi:hypothetical protein
MSFHICQTRSLDSHNIDSNDLPRIMARQRVRKPQSRLAGVWAGGTQQYEDLKPEALAPVSSTTERTASTAFVHQDRFV